MIVVLRIKNMSVTSQSRGHAIYYDNKNWRYVDNNNLLHSENRPCARCKKMPTPEGYDACLGHIERMVSMCCGHGLEKKFSTKRTSPNIEGIT